MRDKRASYIKISVNDDEKAAYEAGAARKGQTISEWVRLSLRATLDEAGYNWQKAAEARAQRGVRR